MTAVEHSLVVDLLDRAATHIERYGHHKGAYYPRNTEVPFTAPRCANGALWLGAGIDPYRSRAKATPEIVQARRVLWTYLAANGLASGHEIPSWFITGWNDAHERTADEVVAALREAARKARQP